MRWLVLLFALSGCMFEPGLESSPTDCPASTPLEDGFLLAIDAPERFVGYCVEIAHDDERIDGPFAARQVPADGRVYLPIKGAGEYYMSISVTDEDDPYCAAHVGEFASHTGAGIVTLNGTANGICA